MDYATAKSMTETAVKDEFGVAQLLELISGTKFNKAMFERQMRAYVAEFGADEQSIKMVLEDMTEVAREVCADYERNEELNAQGYTP